MKTILTSISILLISLSLFGQEQSATNPPSETNQLIKKGWNLGPLPIVAFDADKGFQYGALLNLFDFGDGTHYPNYFQKLYLEASFYTKGSQFFTISYDAKYLIPGVRFSSAVSYSGDKAMDFYGFNGYKSFYDTDRVTLGKEDPNTSLYSPFYRTDYKNLFFKADFIGEIVPNFYWEAGYHLNWIQKGTIDYDKINKNKEEAKQFTEPTLYDNYRQWGIIHDDEEAGGIASALHLGLMYDTRDKEGAPSKGIWAEGHIILAPKFLGTTNPYSKFSVTFRQYVPIIKNDKLTFAYRLNYQGTLSKTAPWYMLPYFTVMGEGYDKDGIGGYRTVRGLMRSRVQALDVAFYNAEFRWRFVDFTLFKQNIAFGLSAFSDGAMTIREFNMDFQRTKADFASNADYQKALSNYNNYMAKGKDNLNSNGRDKLHMTYGAGLRFIMNENFIVAFEYGMPINKQDGNGSFYINIGYLF